jgi:hypothetical protein
MKLKMSSSGGTEGATIWNIRVKIIIALIKVIIIMSTQKRAFGLLTRMAALSTTTLFMFHVTTTTRGNSIANAQGRPK